MAQMLGVEQIVVFVDRVALRAVACRPLEEERRPGDVSGDVPFNADLRSLELVLQVGGEAVPLGRDERHVGVGH